MPPTSTPITGAARAAPSKKLQPRRPVYLVNLRRDRRQPKQKKRQFDEPPGRLKAVLTFVIGGCLGWFVVVGLGLLVFLILFAGIAGQVLPQILARFP